MQRGIRQPRSVFPRGLHCSSEETNDKSEESIFNIMKDTVTMKIMRHC